MAGSGRKKVVAGSRNAWQSSLDEMKGGAPSQAGEGLPSEDDESYAGHSGEEIPIGGGGYGGDAAELGHDAALSEPDRPTDSEIHGDPRTPEGAAFPDDELNDDDGIDDGIGDEGYDGDEDDDDLLGDEDDDDEDEEDEEED